MKFEKQFPSLIKKGIVIEKDDEIPTILYAYELEDKKRWFFDKEIQKYCLDKQKVKHLFAQIRGLLSNPVSLPPELTKYLSEFEDVNLK